VGQRASLVLAREREQAVPGIVDSVVAVDILKLPDLSVTEALQRVQGVQVTRDRGEGGVATLRGLSQFVATLNGREVFTAGNGRTLDFTDVPAEMVSGLDVHKTAYAADIEGGLAGSIDMRTWRPLDFAGPRSVVALRWVAGDLVDKGAAQGSVLLSRRWALDGPGQFGVLLTAVQQDRAWREDQKSAGVPRSDLVPGQTVVAPNGSTETTSLGQRRRDGGSLVLQWQPAERMEWYAEWHAERLRTRQDSHQINLTPTKGTVPSDLALFDGTANLRRATWPNATVSVLSFARDTADTNAQWALGGHWPAAGWLFSVDASHASARNNLYFSGLTLATKAPSFSQDLSGTVPSTSVAGVDLLNPANYTVASLLYRVSPFQGRLDALRLDAEQPLSGFWKSLSLGLRGTRREADDGTGLVFGDVAMTGVNGADKASLLLPNPYANFLPGQGADSVGAHLIGNLALARDPAVWRAALGVGQPIPTDGPPLGHWRLLERSLAAYAQGRFEWPEQAVDGQAGVRAVYLDRQANGWQATGGAAPSPTEQTEARLDWLPSLALRWRPLGDWTLRAGASRSVGWPNFNHLSPMLVLNPNSVDPSLNQGSGGNPAL
jgi:TonB-dependent receptor